MSLEESLLGIISSVFVSLQDLLLLKFLEESLDVSFATASRVHSVMLTWFFVCLFPQESKGISFQSEVKVRDESERKRRLSIRGDTNQKE